MKPIVIWMMAAMLAGCNIVPPKPPECRGEFRPVNVSQKEASLGMNGKIVRCGEGEKDGRHG